MRNRFNEQLDQLHDELIRMGALCEDAITAAAESLQRTDPVMAARAQEAEAAIDQKERDVESLCLQLLLRQQPVAKDLREISAALKLISDLERIGDQAADIAELAPYLRSADEAGRKLVGEMAREACRMVRGSVDAFVRRDLELARQVCADDDRVDDLFLQVKQAIIALLARDPAQGESGLDLLMIAKYFERIGDHATNVAEWVEYAVTGIHPELN